MTGRFFGLPMTTALPALSLLETRVLGVLVEKQHTVADTYPLTLNALIAGCNQKTSRDPVLSATGAEVQATVDRLKTLSLIVESSGGRVMRYAHNVERVLALPSQAVALLATLMLRGPQTLGELRINSDRLHRFADISAVDAFLQELAARPSGALVAELPRALGARENRWMHLLSGGVPPGSVAADGSATFAGDVVTLTETAALQATRRHLEAELDALKSAVAHLRSELGGT